MKEDIRFAKEVGLNGVVLGVLDQDGNIDNDEQQELVFSSDRLYAYNLDGSPVQNFPKFKQPGTQPPLITDLDRDRDIEIILAENYHVNVWDLASEHDPYMVDWPTEHHDPRNTRT